MIYIKRKNTCLLKIPKNASTSITQFTHEFLHVDDVCSDHQWPYNKHTTHMDTHYICSNDLIDADTMIIGFIRNPIERMLSLYLYREKQRRLDDLISPEGFSRFVFTQFESDHMWQKQTQLSFLKHDGIVKATPIRFDRAESTLQNLFETTKPLPVCNKSTKSYNTSELISLFYTSDTLKKVTQYYAEDIELYESLK